MLFVVREEGSKVLLTNSGAKKPGPKKVKTENVYVFAHQAYWGFRFLAEKRKNLWKKILESTDAVEIQEVGIECSKPYAMVGASYGASGLLTWLTKREVALEVLAAKRHRRYPGSERPSSQDRRMISLAVAVAAGIWEISYSSALRKLAEAELGFNFMARDVHQIDRWKETMRQHAYVVAEPLGNYYLPSPVTKKLELFRNLPCPVPQDCQDGYILFGIGPNGAQYTFSRTLPHELEELKSSKENPNAAANTGHARPVSIDRLSGVVTCSCGVSIRAGNPKLVARAFREHKRIAHGSDKSVDP